MQLNEPLANESPATGKRSLQLHSLILNGFRSFESLELKFAPVTILIGANGSGKSNIFEALRMLAAIHAPPGQLRSYVAELGGASRLLHFGPQTTDRIELELRFGDASDQFRYGSILKFSAGDQLHFLEEWVGYFDSGDFGGAVPVATVGHVESMLGIQTSWVAIECLRRIKSIRVFHLEEMDFKSAIRLNADVHDSAELASQGSNLAAFLLRLRDDAPEDYQRVTSRIRLIYPAFADFVLTGLNTIRLQWREVGSTYLFDAHQASNGTMRFFALAALLMQPATSMPTIIALDEPELGLHPTAISVLADMIRAASAHAQIIVATQSPQLLDHFDAAEVVVVEKRQGSTQAERLDPEALKSWLEEFEGEPGRPLSDLWLRNVIGGGPVV